MRSLISCFFSSGTFSHTSNAFWVFVHACVHNYACVCVYVHNTSMWRVSAWCTRVCICVCGVMCRVDLYVCHQTSSTTPQVPLSAWLVSPFPSPGIHIRTAREESSFHNRGGNDLSLWCCSMQLSPPQSREFSLQPLWKHKVSERRGRDQLWPLNSTWLLTSMHVNWIRGHHVEARWVEWSVCVFVAALIRCCKRLCKTILKLSAGENVSFSLSPTTVEK